MAGGKGKGKRSEQQDWQRPAGAFSGKAKKDFLKWKRQQKATRADQEETEAAQEPVAAHGSHGGARLQQPAAQAAAGRRKRGGAGRAADSDVQLHYVPLLDLASPSCTEAQEGATYTAADARLPLALPDEMGFSPEGRTVGMPVRPAWQGIVQSAEELHALEEASFQSWLNDLQQRYGSFSSFTSSSSSQARQTTLQPGATENTNGHAVDNSGAAIRVEQQAAALSVEAGSSTDGVSHTPGGGGGRLGFFETRLDFWRQLWRALEMSDLAVMIVDARCPLLHFSEALYHHATVDQGLQVALLLNKCDLVPEAAIAAWRSFFCQRYPGITVLAASSAADPDGAARSILGWVLQAEVNRGGRRVDISDYIHLNVDELMAESVRRNTHAKRKLKQASHSRQAEQPQSQSSQEEGEKGGMLRAGTARQRRRAALRLRAAADGSASSSQEDSTEHSNASTDSDIESEGLEATGSAEDEEGDSEAEDEDVADACQRQAGAVLSIESLILEAQQQQQQQQVEREEQHAAGTSGNIPAMPQPTAAASTALQPVVLCVVGEPNVGKSSTLNALLGTHRLAVSSHPGRTKHYQTHFMASGFCVCDSPGLVFPRLDVRLPLQVLYGSFPIARCSDPYAAIRYLAERLWPRLHQRLALSRHRAEDGGEAAPTHSSTHDTASTEPEGCDDSAWTPVALCEALAAKRGWRSRRGGRLDTYRAANWLLRAALGGREGLVLAFVPPEDV